MATPRASTLLRMVFLLVLVARPVWAAGPQISVEGGESYVGGYFTLNDGAPLFLPRLCSTSMALAAVVSPGRPT